MNKEKIGVTEMKQLLTAFTMFGLMGVVSVQAATIAYSDPAGAGNQAFTGNLSLDFDVESPISVTALGVFNASGSGTITGTIDVAIYDNFGNQVVGPVAFNGVFAPGPGFDVFQSITPVTLAAGLYSVDAVGFSATDLNGNINLGGSGPTLNTGGGLLAFDGATYDGSTVLDDPATCAGCQAAPSPQNVQFDAGTFEFQSAIAAPEPGTFAFFGAGLIALSAALRRKLTR
jgi:hypothetical protein